ncbi:MAG: hypothetical protein IPI81_15930 [Flavobacteriales bacterium]|nr:hypothetical protein [Flavobacteriales bacterium]
MAKNNPPVFPPADPVFKMPFFYSSLSLIWTYYWVDEKLVLPLLKDTRLKPARFTDPESKGKVLISLNFQNYSAFLGMMISTVNEIEFNVHCYPEKHEAEVPVMSLQDYLYGQDATKLIGEMRLHVPADNAVAVQAGVKCFGERKFLTTFDYMVPTPDAPTVENWAYTVYDPTFEGDKSKALYTLTADLSVIPRRVANPSPLTLYSMLPGGPNRPAGGKDMDLIGSRWNMFGVYDMYLGLTPAQQKSFTLTIGKTQHPMAVDLRATLGKGAKVCAVRVFVSPPAAAENRPYYVDLGKKKK